MPVIKSYVIEPMGTVLRSAAGKQGGSSPGMPPGPSVLDRIVFEKLVQVLWCSAAPSALRSGSTPA
jgi:hypothetical protein